MLDTSDVIKFVNSRIFLEKYYTYIMKKGRINNIISDFGINKIELKENFDKIVFETSYLANGEYNCNYRIKVLFQNKKIDDMVFRVNYASQMDLENQIEYEFMGLGEVSRSNFTPVPYFYDDSKAHFSQDYLIMSFIDGRPMEYNRDILGVARCLSEIHRLEIPSDSLFIEPDNPFKAILDESTSMYAKYLDSALFDIDIDIRVKKIFNKVRKICSEYESSKKIDVYSKEEYKNLSNKKSILNTELNSSNFIVGEKIYLVDWEKPIIGEKEQDLGHFLAPTTTFWKTDIILNKNQIEEFLISYFDDFYGVGYRKNHMYEFDFFKKKVYDYIVINCLRGISWCSMAWVEYNKSEKILLNEFTFNKLKEYLDIEYLDMVIKDFIES